jgi:hypothetical protein
MNRDLLPDGIVIAYHKATDFGVSLQGQNLRPATDGAIGKQVVAFTYHDFFGYNHVGVENGACTYRCAAIYHAVRTDYTIVAYFGVTRYYRAWVYLLHQNSPASKNV